MPRIYASNNDPCDYCAECYPNEDSVTWHRLQNMGDGPDGRGNCFADEADHPDYEDDEYHCQACGELLTNIDN